MADKYFKKIYSDRTAYGKWKTGDGINYNDHPDGRYTVEFITKTQYTNGVATMPPIPKTKEQLVEEKKEELAVDSLKTDGVLDSNGDIV